MSKPPCDKPRLPVIGEYNRGHGVLVEIQDVTPPPPSKEIDYIYEDSTATYEVRSNGTVIANGETYNNFYGLGTCVQHAKEAAIKYALALGESSLEVVVVKTTRRYRARPNNEYNLYDRHFLDFNRLSRGAEWDLPAAVVEDVFTTKTGSLVESLPKAESATP